MKSKIFEPNKQYVFDYLLYSKWNIPCNIIGGGIFCRVPYTTPPSQDWALKLNGALVDPINNKTGVCGNCTVKRKWCREVI